MLLTREQLEEREYKMLAAYAVKNMYGKGRVYEELQDPYRLDFQRDRDRVIHSHAFRRLRDKTQVFTSRFGDHYRNRMVHTLEVAQISRDIARNLAVNEDLAETIALAHDLGHTPFGHAGEDTLNELMEEYNETFEHNQQSKRVVTYLEHRSNNFPGLNLTLEVLDGLAKHQTQYDQAGVKMKDSMSIEGQIVNLADELAYQVHDTDDGIRSGILQLEEVLDLKIFHYLRKIGTHTLPFPKEVNASHLHIYMSVLMKMMVQDVCLQTEKNIRNMNIETIEDVYKSSEKIVSFSKEMTEYNSELRDFLYNKFYFDVKVKKQTERGQNIIRFLFGQYMKNPPDVLKEKIALSKDPIHIVIKDYIAGMTDDFAMKAFNK